MTEHLHAQFVPGCYRCELGRDEVAALSYCEACGQPCDDDECLCSVDCLIPPSGSNR